MKKAIIMMQWVATFVSDFLNHFFLSPQTRGIQNLYEMIELKEETKSAIVFICNHINANDPFVVTGFFPSSVKEKVFPITFLASHDKFGGKMKSSIMHLLGCIPVGNGSGENVRETIRRIRNGETVYLFPEGRVSKDGEMGSDLGALEMFSKFADIVVQPVHVDGLRYFWDIRNMLMGRRQVLVKFGKPFVLRKGSKIDAVAEIAKLGIQKRETISFEGVQI